ncbi:SETMR methyltransferase, partial [Acromyrmex insinuator]
MNSIDIHVIFLYEYKLGKNAKAAKAVINQAFGENTVNDRKVQRWFEKFRSGDFFLQNEPRGRLKTSVKNDALKALVETNLTVKKMDKWVPHELSENVSSLLTRFHREPFFDRIITCDENYIDEMHEKLKIIRPSLVNRYGPILLHDNARPHTSYKTIAKLNELKYEILQHPAYSPDLSTTDFHFFKHLEQFLRAKQYENEDRK